MIISDSPFAVASLSAFSPETAQMILYKEFYAKQYNVDVESIDIEYVIVRRKINHDLEFVPKRIQTFVPANGKVSRNKIFKLFDLMVSEKGDLSKSDFISLKSRDFWESSTSTFTRFATSEPLL